MNCWYTDSIRESSIPRPGGGASLGTFSSRRAAEKHEREVQDFKRG